VTYERAVQIYRMDRWLAKQSMIAAGLAENEAMERMRDYPPEPRREDFIPVSQEKS